MVDVSEAREVFVDLGRVGVSYEPTWGWLVWRFADGRAYEFVPATQPQTLDEALAVARSLVPEEEVHRG